MEQVRATNSVVTEIGNALCTGLDAELRARGGVLPPTVHILAEDLDPPYVGYVSCRQFCRGADAAAAITELGVLPSVLAATRLVVAWEAQDMNAALEAPVEPDSAALVLLDAHVSGVQQALWCPLRCRPGEPGEGAVVVAQWGPPALLEDPPLPGPVAALLALWRQWLDLDLDKTVWGLESIGYRVRFAER